MMRSTPKTSYPVLLTLLGCAAPSLPTDLGAPPLAPAWGKPISGGTVAIDPGGTAVAVADPDRDRIAIVMLETRSVLVTLDLEPGDEPGRVAWDGAGRAHVALRGGGAVVTVANGDLAERRPVCAEPRGIAWDAANDLIQVACSGGELVSLPAAGGEAVREVRLPHDLRDVIVRGPELLVSRFRSAELLRLDAAGEVVETLSPPSETAIVGSLTVTVATQASVAWRTVAMPDGTIVMAHQRRRGRSLSTEPGGYGSDGCGVPPVEEASSLFPPGAPALAGRALPTRGLVVDAAVSDDGELVAFAGVGMPMVDVYPTSILSAGDLDPCGATGEPPTDPPDEVAEQHLALSSPATSVAFRPGLPATLVVFEPEEDVLLLVGAASGLVTGRIALQGPRAHDPGRGVFHEMTGSGLACATCHPEGRDDGLIWSFQELGLRRTQSVAGGILARAPYHWSGEMPDLSTLVNAVRARMSSPSLTPWQVETLAQWLDTIPPPAPPTPQDPEAVLRGEALFTSEEVGCGGCHQGALFTSNELVDVGTGGFLKVPSLLGVWARAPYLHDGRAPTLRARFEPLGGGDQHGMTSQLSEAQLADLIAYLESL